jgi:1-acyl-sn-glycerol-3-phosphate acyltransferase
MPKIHGQPLSYQLSKKMVVWMFKKFYSNYIVVGKENLPTEGPLIFAPNHRNALMDALAILSVTSSHYSTSFLSRSDIFKKGIINRFLTFANMMPAFRIRDGFDQLGRNAEVFEKCIELLKHNNALCIMPEGNQELEQKIRPLVKGIFRIAYSTQEKLGTSKNVKIIPVGIDLGDLIKARKHIIISIGKPIEVSDYMELYATNQPIAINKLRDKLSSDLKEMVVDIASEKNYEVFENLIKITEAEYLTYNKLPNTIINKFIARKNIATQLIGIENTNNEKTLRIVDLTKRYSSMLQKLKLRTSTLDHAAPASYMLLLDALLLLFTFPVFIHGLIFNLFPFFTPVLIRKYVFKAQYSGFFSSIHFGAGLLSFPFFYSLQAILIGVILSTSFWIPLILLPGQYILGKWALTWNGEFQKLKANYRYSKLNKQQSDDVKSAIEIKKQLFELIFH